jgi:hypothetical protein
LLALGFGASRVTASRFSRGAGWLALGAYLVVLAVPVVEGRNTRMVNARRDRAYAAQQHAVDAYRLAITEAMVTSPHDSARLDQMIRDSASNRAFAVGALETHMVSAAMLDSLSRSSDLGVVGEAVRQPNALPSTIDAVYWNKPDYFAAMVAGHPHSPAHVLDDLARRASDPYLLRQLEANPSLPDSTRRRVSAALAMPDSRR